MDEGARLARMHTGIDAHRVEFTGSGAEYFRVWIVNLLLTVVTLGLYTPFARRRTARYFYSHTVVAGSPLEFTVTGGRMLLGFLLLVGLYIAFNLAAGSDQQVATALMLVGGAVLAPYFWASAMRFRMSSTRWRGVRLQFAATWPQVYRAAWPMLVMAIVWIGVSTTMATIAPHDRASRVAPSSGEIAVLFAVLGGGTLLSVIATVVLDYQAKCLVVLHGRVGGQPGRWKPELSDFFRIWLAAAGLFLACVLVASAVAGVLAFFAIGAVRGSGAGAKIALVALVPLAAILLLVAASAPARAYRQARVFRLVWNNIGVSRIARFKSRLRVRRYVTLRLRNVLLTLLTLGLYRPFALVSEYRMRAESVSLHVKGGLDQLAGQLAREEQALGDAVAGAMGLDLVG
ncbi:YjgN family protein [Ramlibacter sp. MMS24-I3-19]|uniref:YjgN family protein n=1 Tax=Ramlibacter sp. MMS24-I3-19 TaxID=3416606 RepID=UPI003CFE220E